MPTATVSILAYSNFNIFHDIPRIYVASIKVGVFHPIPHFDDMKAGSFGDGPEITVGEVFKVDSLPEAVRFMGDAVKLGI